MIRCPQRRVGTARTSELQHGDAFLSPCGRIDLTLNTGLSTCRLTNVSMGHRRVGVFLPDLFFFYDSCVIFFFYPFSPLFSSALLFILSPPLRYSCVYSTFALLSVCWCLSVLSYLVSVVVLAPRGWVLCLWCVVLSVEFELRCFVSRVGAVVVYLCCRFFV